MRRRAIQYAARPAVNNGMSWIKPSIVCCVALAGLALAPLWVQPAAAEARRGDHGRHLGPGYGRYYPPEIQVFADPDSEHWPANYLPDNHHLDSYDGKPDRATVCAGSTGRSWSTRERECPPGQKAAQPGQRWSTSP